MSGTYLRNRLTGNVFKAKYPVKAYFGTSNRDSAGKPIFERVKKPKTTKIRRNPRGNYTTAEKKSIKRHTRKAIKRSGVAVRRMVSQAKRLTRVARNPKPARAYIIEALVRDGQKLHYRFWTGEGNKQRALLTERNRAKKFHSQTMARGQAKRLLPYCSSKIVSLRVVPA